MGEGAWMGAMSPWHDDGQARFYHGDVLNVLRELSDNSVQCCVTSPPYWGLRDYGTATWEGGDEGCDHRSPTMREGRNEDRAKLAGSEATNAAQLLLAARTGCGKCGARRIDQQLGLEATPEEYVERMVAVFREVRRVLRDDGTLWVNIGDSYAGGPSGTRGNTTGFRNGQEYAANYRGISAPGLKPKDLVGIPWMLAFALRADGWWLRSDIIWAKPNPMPESVTDRPTKAHEYVFLLTKRDRYYYDADAVREAGTTINPPARNGVTKGTDGISKPDFLANGYYDATAGRNKRTVWTIATEPFSGRELLGDTGGTVSPDCPVHGDSPLARQVRQRALRDAQRDRSTRRNVDTDGHPALGLAGESASTTSPHSDQDCAGDTPETHTPGSMAASRTTPSLPFATEPTAAAETTGRSSRTPGQGAPSNSDSPGLVHFETATQHSKGSRRTAPAPATTQPYTASAQNPADIEHIEVSPANADSAEHTPASSRGEAAVADARGNDPAEQSPGGNAYRCTCSNSTTDHFATFPTDLVKPCILAGTSERGACSECGAPWERVVEPTEEYAKLLGKGFHDHQDDLIRGQRNGKPVPGGPSRLTTGWRPTCSHEAPTVPCVVLDPFLGSGTTAYVAKSLGRHAIGIDLNETYLELARRRCAQMGLMA